MADDTAQTSEVVPLPRCTSTRGYCECDKPDDGHRYHHCPECATHPNGGWAFSTWVNNPMIPTQYRMQESMHEYADVSDPWSATATKPPASPQPAPTEGSEVTEP